MFESRFYMQSLVSDLLKWCIAFYLTHQNLCEMISTNKISGFCYIYFTMFFNFPHLEYSGFVINLSCFDIQVLSLCSLKFLVT